MLASRVDVEYLLVLCLEIFDLVVVDFHLCFLFLPLLFFVNFGDALLGTWISPDRSILTLVT